MAKNQKAVDQQEGSSAEGTALPNGALRLAYFIGAEGVKVVLHRAEKKGEIGPADLVEEVTLRVEDFPAKFEDGAEGKTLAAYGLCKLVQDRTSQVAGCAEKFQAMVKEAQRLQETGAWRNAVERKEGATRTGSRKVDTLVAKALSEMKSIDLAVAEATLKKLDKESYDKICKHARVQELVAQYKSEVSAEAPETDLADLLV